MNHIVCRLFVLCSILILTGCATGTHPRDPLEKVNRAVFVFNDKVDDVALKPAAMAYQDIIPQPVQFAVGNFFGNLNDVWIGTNQFLQGNVEKGLSDFMRVAVNTMLGFGGLIDLASAAGIPKHQQDFGTTLGVWGVPAGPYVVLPFWGPYTMRDTVAAPFDIYGDPWTYVEPTRVRYTGYGVRLIDKRAVLLNASNLIEDAALDRYVFVRDAFLQRREDKVEEAKGSEEAWQDLDPQAALMSDIPAYHGERLESEPSRGPIVLPSTLVFRDIDATSNAANMEAVQYN